MTWKSHCLANGALAYVLTGRLDITAAAMVTATLPDRIEALLPFGHHRGASHWVTLWLGVMIAVPFYAHRELLMQQRLPFARAVHGWPAGSVIVGAVAFGLALGPFLHVLLDGCSDSGVPVAPFSRWQLKLGMYRTYNFRWRWDLSEQLFLGVIIAVCAAFYRIHGWAAYVPW